MFCVCDFSLSTILDLSAFFEADFSGVFCMGLRAHFYGVGERLWGGREAVDRRATSAADVERAYD